MPVSEAAAETNTTRPLTHFSSNDDDDDDDVTIVRKKNPNAKKEEWARSFRVNAWTQVQARTDRKDP